MGDNGISKTDDAELGHTTLVTMSNLTPTPRTDKNGRTVIRHMKTEQATVLNRAPLPTVGQLVRRTSPRDAVHKYFMEEWVRFDKEKLGEALDLIEKECADTIPVLHRFLTAETSDDIHSYIDAHIGAVIKELIDLMGSAQYNSNWRSRCNDTLSTRFPADVNRLWHALHVSQEVTSEIMDTAEIALWTRSTQILIESDWDAVDDQQDDVYWRGMTALTIYQLQTGKQLFYNDHDLISQIPGFVELSGTHPDIRKVVEVATERSTIDAEVIRDIMAQQEPAPAIGNGVL